MKSQLVGPQTFGGMNLTKDGKCYFLEYYERQYFNFNNFITGMNLTHSNPVVSFI